MAWVDRTQETEFERPRGILEVTTEDGYSQIHAGGLPHPIHENRLLLLQTVRSSATNIKMLKMTPSGLSFLVREHDTANLEQAVSVLPFPVSIRPGRSLVYAHSVNMRDEEGLIARVLAIAIGSGGHMEHVGDRHDCLIIAAEDGDAAKIADALRAELETRS